MKKTFNLTLIASLAFSAAPIFAQDVIELDDITLSANLDEIEAERTGASVEIIDEDEIEQAGYLTLSEFLGDYAGVSVTRNGPIGGNSSVLIRGARQYEVKVLIDGIDVSDPSLVQSYFNFGSMGMSDVSRVEIVKGSQSSLYGGSAVGGVISITTKEPLVNGFSGSSAIEYGSYNTGAASLTLAHGGDNHEVAVSYNKIMSDGFSAVDENDGATEADGFEGDRWSFSASYDVNNSLTIGASGFVAESTADTDTTFPSFADDDSTYGDKQNAVRAYVNYHNDNMEHEVSFSRLNTERDFITPTASYSYAGIRDEAKYAGNLNVNESFQLSGGVIWTKETYDQTGDFGDLVAEAENLSVYAGANFAVSPQFDLNLSARNDKHDNFGNHQSWRAAAAYRPIEGTVIRGAIGSGFRAPSLYELYGDFVGNPALEVETSLSYEIGVEQDLGANAKLGLTLFALQTENQINYDFTTFTYNNLEGTTKRSGLELSGSAELTDRVSTNFAYTYLNTEDPNGYQLARIPKHELNVGVDVELTEGLVLGVQGKMVRDVFENAEFDVPLDDYNLVNARLGYQIGEGEVYARVENMFDEQYQTAKGYGTSDRAFYVGFSVNF